MKILSRLNGQKHEVNSAPYDDFQKALKDFDKALSDLVDKVYPVEEFTRQEIQKISDFKKQDEMDSDEAKKLFENLRLKYASNYATAPALSKTITDLEDFFERWNKSLIDRHDHIIDTYKEQEEIITENFPSNEIPRILK